MKPSPKPKKRTTPSKPKPGVRLGLVCDRLQPDDPLKVMYYRASEGKASGLVVFAPGSRGGMGPGQLPATIGQFGPKISCVYPHVAEELAKRGIASVQFTWRLNPTRKGAPPGTLKSPTQLMLGVADIALAARYLRGQQGKRGARLPLALVGFSFGGPSVMAAAALAVARGESATSAAAAANAHGVSPLAGVVTLGCGMRVAHAGSAAFKDVGNQLSGGASRARPHDYGGVDSESCVDAYAAAGLPLCMIHGLADVTVDPRASRAIFERALGPKTALWMRDADHHARSRIDVQIDTLLDWLPALLQRARVPLVAPTSLLCATPSAPPRPAAPPLQEAGGNAPHVDGAAVEPPIEREAAAEEGLCDAPQEEEELERMVQRWALDVDMEEPGSSGAPSDIDDEPSASVARVAPARPDEAAPMLPPTRAMLEPAVCSLAAAQAQRRSGGAPELPFVDDLCPFLDGQARTV